MTYPFQHKGHVRDWPQDYDAKDEGDGSQDCDTSMISEQLEDGTVPTPGNLQPVEFDGNWVDESVNQSGQDHRPLPGYGDQLQTPNTTQCVSHSGENLSYASQSFSEVSATSGGQYCPESDAFPYSYRKEETCLHEHHDIATQDQQGTDFFYTAPAIPTRETGQPFGTIHRSSAEIQTSNSRGSLGTNTHSSPNDTQLGSAEHNVVCPYGCGTMLTGVHAAGNLTRHLKSHAYLASGQDKVRHVCQIQGCGKEYTRSDGLKVHMRRRHGAPPAVPKNGMSVGNDDDE